MSHPLEAIIEEADGFLLIGDAASGRFPALSYAAYVHAKKRFYCIDLSATVHESRGPHKGGKVYHRVEDLPEDRGDLAVIWVKPSQAAAAVDVASAAGCTRVWFSFKTGHADAIARANELGMDIVEVGRCPVYYLPDVPTACKAHTWITKVSGTRARPPAVTADPTRREQW